MDAVIDSVVHALETSRSAINKRQITKLITHITTVQVLEGFFATNMSDKTKLEKTLFDNIVISGKENRTSKRQNHLLEPYICVIKQNC